MEEERMECIWCGRYEVELFEGDLGEFASYCGYCGAHGPDLISANVSESEYLAMLAVVRAGRHVKSEVEL